MKYTGHLYKWEKSFGHVRHHWELRSKHGGVHFHVSEVEGYSTTAGLEFHSIYPRGDDAPSHVNCPITGGRCWHDGTSLYATETLWPMIKHDLATGNHDAIFKLLEHESRRLEECAPDHKPSTD
jgi:hypothetical protein